MFSSLKIQINWLKGNIQYQKNRHDSRRQQFEDGKSNNKKTFILQKTGMQKMSNVSNMFVSIKKNEVFH